MGYYDFSAPVSGTYPDIRSDLGTALTMLRSLEDLYGLDQTTWHPDFGGGTGTQTHFAPHQCVMIGGVTAGYLRDAVDRVRAEAGIAAFDWSGTTVPTNSIEWGASTTKGMMSLNDVLFIKQAIGRLIVPSAISTLHGGTGAVSTLQAYRYDESASGNALGVSRDCTDPTIDPYSAVTKHWNVSVRMYSVAPESIESAGSASVGNEIILTSSTTSTNTLERSGSATAIALGSGAENVLYDDDFSGVATASLSVAENVYSLASELDIPASPSGLTRTLNAAHPILYVLGAYTDNAELHADDAADNYFENVRTIANAFALEGCPTPGFGDYATVTTSIQYDMDIVVRHNPTIRKWAYFTQPYTPAIWPWSLMP